MSIVTCTFCRMKATYVSHPSPVDARAGARDRFYCREHFRACYPNVAAVNRIEYHKLWTTAETSCHPCYYARRVLRV